MKSYIEELPNTLLTCLELFSANLEINLIILHTEQVNKWGDPIQWKRWG